MIGVSVRPFLFSILIVFSLVLAACQMPVKTTERERPSSAAASSRVQSEDIGGDVGGAISGAGDSEVESASVGGAVSATPSVSDSLAAAGQGATGVLIAYEFRGDATAVPGGGCRLKLENVRTRRNVFVSLKVDQRVVFKELEPGRYFATRLSCGALRIWNMDNLFGPGFDVVEGKLSYVGKVNFEMTRKDLNGFRQAPRAESRAALAAVRDAVAGEMVSAYTLRPIDSEMLLADGPESFDVFAKGTSAPDQTLADLMSRLKRCASNAAKDDPLRLGHLTYVAKYNAGNFTEMAEKRDAHALSENFTTCVDNSLRTFKPPVASGLEVRVAY